MTTFKLIRIMLQPAPMPLTYSIGNVTYVPCKACGVCVRVGAYHFCSTGSKVTA